LIQTDAFLANFFEIFAEPDRRELTNRVSQIRQLDLDQRGDIDKPRNLAKSVTVE